jgi:hypothetical protein
MKRNIQLGTMINLSSFKFGRRLKRLEFHVSVVMNSIIKASDPDLGVE